MKKTLIIAEAGVNHNGRLELAKRLVDWAKECGADVVKFQTAKLDSLVSEYAATAEYQKRNTGIKESQKSMLGRLLLSYDAFIDLSSYCERVGIKFLSTPFDLESIEFLNCAFDMPFWKIPSGEVTNLPYLMAIAETRKPVVMSTGMCEMEEIGSAISILRKHGTPDITLLQCNTEYPTPYEDVNLHAMQTMRERFGVPVGYSDHTRGIEISVAAVALGACMIEKHFTLDRNMEGPDHNASLEPDELAAMIRSIRNVELALGDGMKTVSASERKNISIARKSIVAKRAIKKGEILTEENITTKRPGDGISPMRWFDILGTAAIRDFGADEMIEQ